MTKSIGPSVIALFMSVLPSLRRAALPRAEDHQFTFDPVAGGALIAGGAGADGAFVLQGMF